MNIDILNNNWYKVTINVSHDNGYYRQTYTEYVTAVNIGEALTEAYNSITRKLSNCEYKRNIDNFSVSNIVAVKEA